MLTRRQVNIGAASAAALLSAGRLARAQTQTIVLKTGHWNPPNHPLHKAFLAWSDELEKLSNGRLKLQVYPSGQLGGDPVECMRAIQPVL